MVDQEPFGSFYLNAHYVDVTFGDITVTGLPRNAILSGEDSLSTLLAADYETTPATPAPVVSDQAGGASVPPAMIAELSSLLANADDPAVAA